MRTLRASSRRRAFAARDRQGWLMYLDRVLAHGGLNRFPCSGARDWDDALKACSRTVARPRSLR